MPSSSKPLDTPLLRRGFLALNLLMPALVLGLHAPWWMIALSIPIHGAFAWTVLAPNGFFFGPVVTRFVTEEKEVWLTIDDGLNSDSVSLARLLAERNVQATFFVIGKRLAQHKTAASLILELGHTLANHSWSHPAGTFWCLEPRRLRKEVVLCHEVLKQTNAGAPRWFRAPFGLKHPHLHALLARLGLRFIAWNIRGHDGIVCEPEAVVKRVVAQVKPGAIILLHEGRPRSLETILAVIQELQNRGYSFVIPADDQLR